MSILSVVKEVGITIVVLATFAGLIAVLLTGFLAELLLCISFVVTLMLVARPLQAICCLRHRLIL